MKKLNDLEYEKLINDITTIKNVLAKSKSSLQFVFLPVHYWLMSLVAGISTMFLASVYYFLVRAYGVFSAVPDLYRYIFYAVICIDWLGLVFLKHYNWTCSVSSMNPEYTFKRAFMEFITFKTVHIYIVFLVTTVFFVVYWIVNDQFYLIIPTLSISFGLILNMIGNMTELVPYIVYGSWMLITGLIIFAVGTIPGALAVVLSFGLGCILFSIHSYISRNR